MTCIDTRIAPPVARTISTVTPIKDEEDAIPVLVERILEVARRANLPLVEIILVDDGSRDDTWSVAEKLAERIAEVHAIRLRRNFGKATALMVGIEKAVGDVIITMDGDLQDDPEELPRFVQEIEKGADLVSGWKKERHDPLSKTLPSRIFNRATAWVSGISLHDFNCGYKAYRREIFSSVELYGELHRYIPVLAHAFGFKITELVVRHHPRRFGRSKYGLARYFRGFLDLLTVLTITRFAHRPSHLFGGIGAILIILGTGFLAYLTGLKIFSGAEIGSRPLLTFGVLLDVIGVQLLLFGMLAELVVSRSPKVVQLRELVMKEAGSRAV